jgi:hypothetical protein
VSEMAPEAPEPEVDIYVTNAVRTSRGPGTGQMRLPASEANRIAANRLGVLGTQPPRGYLDGGNPAAIVEASRAFSPRPHPKVAQSN